MNKNGSIQAHILCEVNSRLALRALVTIGLWGVSTCCNGPVLAQQINPPQENYQSSTNHPHTETSLFIQPKVTVSKEREQPFLVERIDVSGSTIYKDNDFAAYFTEYLNKQITLSDLNILADRLTKKYRKDGYALSRVVVPAKPLRNGVAHLQAVEGFIDTVEIRGITADKRVDAYMAKMIGLRPLYVKELGEHLLMMYGLLGEEAKVTVLPTPGTSGASTLTLELVKKDRQAP